MTTSSGDGTVSCSSCGADVEPLDLFPRQRCLSCHARAYDTLVGLRVVVPSADDVTRMWGGHVSGA